MTGHIGGCISEGQTAFFITMEMRAAAYSEMFVITSTVP
jgi:hypothetical protein